MSGVFWVRKRADAEIATKSVNEPRLCPNCGNRLADEGPAGNCPNCLFTLAASLASETGLANETQLQPQDAGAPLSGAPQVLHYFGDYELLEEIARGGMGVVYRARQVSLNRIVAVKVLLFGQFASDEFVQRFRTEAEAAANLHHPNIVAIHEIGEHEGRQYFSMDYVPGGHLGDLVRQQPLPAKRAAALLKTIAEAVHHAHQRGVLHRDLKPSNVLLDAEGQPRLTDFGLAKRLDETPPTSPPSQLTVTGQMLGTPSYASPEQAGGRRRTVTTASDVYSLGAILYFLLTARPPFLGESLEETLHQVLQQEPVSPRLLHPSLPRDLETICLKCLEKEPHKRYGSAQALAEELERFLHDRHLLARPAGPPEKLWRWCRRRPLVAGLVVALHVVLAIGLTGILWQWREARRAQRETTERLYESYLAQARGMRLSDAAGRRQAELDLLAKAVAIRPSLELRMELRNEAIATLATRDVRLGRTWKFANPASVGSWHFDGSLRHYAFADGTNGVRIRRVSDDAEVTVLRHPSRPVKELYGLHAFSPDGRFVSVRFEGEEHCVVWEVATARVMLEDPGFRHGIDFSRDGNRFAASHADGTIRIHDLGSGREMAFLEAGRPLDFLRFNPEGNRVLGCNVRETQFDTWDVATGQVQTFTAPDQLNYADWGPGDLLAAGAVTGRIFVWDARSGQLRQIIPAHESEIQQVTFNHGGDLLASVSWDDQTRFSNPLTGRVEIGLPRLSGRLMFSPDDRQCATIFMPAGTGQALLEIQESPVLERIESFGHLRHAWSLGFSPDGRWLASAVGQGTGVRVFDAAARRLAVALPECEGRTVIFEPDGRGMLATTSNGIVRLPLTTAGLGTNPTISFGPPKVIAPLTNVAVASLSRDGRWLACTAGPNEVWLLDLQNPKDATLLGRQRSALMVAVSPDGQWVACGNWHGYDGVWIWNTRTREVVKRVPMGQVKLDWSPDGRWVAVAGITEGQDSKFLVLEADSWKVHHESESLASVGTCVFSPDSRLVAFVSDGGRAIRLHEVGSFRQLATLEAPNHGAAGWLAFSPDGARLAALEYRQGIQIWDLPRLREELRTLGLDWESPPRAR